jgi:hypothetical protein
MFGKKKIKHSEKLHILKVAFVCEQDGIPERDLKRNFVLLFKERDYVHSAYLARVRYNDSNELNVAFCVRMEWEDDPTLRKTIEEIFAAKFNQQEHLDIIFISNKQEDELKQVCRPFYEKKCQQDDLANLIS